MLHDIISVFWKGQTTLIKYISMHYNVSPICSSRGLGQKQVNTIGLFEYKNNFLCYISK